jgi:hypothetical protein
MGRGGGQGSSRGGGRGQGRGPGRMGGFKAAGPGGKCICPNCRQSAAPHLLFARWPSTLRSASAMQ